MKRVLTEYYALCEGGVCHDYLTEQEKREVANGTIYLTGILQKADTKNGNGRIYPKKVLEREIERYQESIKRNTAVGSLDHPADDTEIKLDSVSHLITECWWDDDQQTVMGKLKILNTPKGQVVRGLVEGGVQIGISSRGLGSLKRGRTGELIVENDFELICFDIVQEPSTPGAYLSNESERSNIQFDFKTMGEEVLKNNRSLLRESDNIKYLLKNYLESYD